MEIKPFYPATEQMPNAPLEILFEAEVTEQGNIVNAKNLQPLDASDDFKRTAQLAVSLWRFQPVVRDACRIGSQAACPVHFKR
jgi:hypothetical protein